MTDPRSPPETKDSFTRMREMSVWLFAFGYFACYVPYSALTKALSKGLLPGMDKPLPGLAFVPITTLASAVGMIVAFSALRWWRFAGTTEIGSFRVPTPTRWTFLSGMATGTIVVTTTLAYTFSGVSIPFVMLLMRGGVLLIAPVVDAITGRKVRWFSWVALGLSLLALTDALAIGRGIGMPLACAVDIGLYLLGYFVRLQFMSRLAKSQSADDARRYFVEEQMVATPVAVIALAAVAFLGHGTAAATLRAGFTDLWSHPALLAILAVGIFSQGTGFFGGLVLLDAKENTFCVPLNRASSVLAGLLAALALAAYTTEPAPTTAEFVGAALLVIAILVLWWGPQRDRTRSA